MRIPLGKYTLLFAALLVIPAIPFLLFGEFFETNFPAQILQRLGDRPHGGAVAAAVVVLLGVDVLLPIPSSMVCSLAGSLLGVTCGVFFVTLGLTIGALLGFALGKMLGRPAMQRWIGETELQNLDTLTDRYGVTILILLRPVPLFAEASTLLLGCNGMRAGTFLLAVLPIHLLLALVYVLVGTFLGAVPGMILSVVIALGLSMASRMMLKN